MVLFANMVCSCTTAKAYFQNEKNFPEYQVLNEKKHFWEKDEYVIKNIRFSEKVHEEKKDSHGNGYYKRTFVYSRDGKESASIDIICDKRITDLKFIQIIRTTKFMQIHYKEKMINIDYDYDESLKQHYLNSGNHIRYEKINETFQNGRKYTLWGNIASGYKIFFNNELIGVMNLLNYPSVYCNEELCNKLAEDEIDQLNIEIMCIYIMNRTPD